jgi:hypothetical protein
MIDIAVIASITHLYDLSARGTIDMGLAHLVLASNAYASYLRARADAGGTVILDNSAYELEAHTGQGMPAGPVLHAADRISATVVICQDVLYDGPATVAATQRFLTQAAGLPYQLMAVPQGRTRAEWLDCYRALADLPGIHRIGLSKLSVPRCFHAEVAPARLACVDALLPIGVDKPLHLLGGDRSLPWELAQHRRRGNDRFITGNDSSFAFWYAATGIPVDGTTGRAPHEPPNKPDLETTTLDAAPLQMAAGNVHLLRQAAGLATPAAVEAS